MTNQHHERAAALVSAFREVLGDSLCRQISDAQFRDLDRLIRELLSTELRDAAERIEEVARSLRRETDIRELGM
jgi:methyl coenzyme M reductase gamma subunit